MLFNTWSFAAFVLIVLSGLAALRKTRWWLPWLTVASYCFYGWLNPRCLWLLWYVTASAYFAALLMDRCAPEAPRARLGPRLLRLRFDDPVMKAVFLGGAVAALGLLCAAALGPEALRPTAAALGLVALLTCVGGLCSSRGVWLVVGLLNTLIPLLLFKYAHFVGENVNAVLAGLHAPVRVADSAALLPLGLEALLPAGLSFFTFQALSYVIDCYLERTPCERSLLRFATFVGFFPTVLMGPIERAGHLLPQLRQPPPIRLQNFTDGLSLFLVGLFKKMALAGYLALYVTRVYDNPGGFGAPELLLATIAFGWQLYFDFSGYTDMARGVAKLMGFNLVLNFRHPYLATGLGDFWRRWHISFSRWILDYIFMPLQMRWREWRGRGTALALLVTFVVSGLWHGAAWTFVIWGALHGLGLGLTYGLERSAFYRKRVPTLVKRAWVFAYVTFAWVFFRAGSLQDAHLIVGRLFTAPWQTPQMPLLMVALVALVWLYEHLSESGAQTVLRTSFVRVGLAVSMAVYLVICPAGGGAFVYLQF